MQASHLEMKGKHKEVHGLAGGTWMLGPAPTALGLFPSKPVFLLGWGWGIHGFAGVGPSP